ncbi:MAG: hypothetical protein DRG09_04775 [Epsilonproteobacteria bacterium]|nr:MAG: hypothetical protein DRG09_04775 [Campylobacterota bacterium]
MNNTDTKCIHGIVGHLKGKIVVEGMETITEVNTGNQDNNGYENAETFGICRSDLGEYGVFVGSSVLPTSQDRANNVLYMNLGNDECEEPRQILKDIAVNLGNLVNAIDEAVYKMEVEEKEVERKQSLHNALTKVLCSYTLNTKISDSGLNEVLDSLKV